MRRVLVVEDEEAMLNKLTSLLREVEDLEIDTARDEASALRLIEANRYQIALVDMELGPGVKERYAGIVVMSALVHQGCIPLVVSGTGDDTLKGVTTKLSGYDYVSKPFNDGELLNKVEHALDWADQKGKGLGPRTWPTGLTEAKDNPLEMFWKNKPLGLTVSELTLVRALAKSPGETIENEKLRKLLKTGNSPSALSSHFTNIRKRFREIDGSFNHISNTPGKGYCWK